MKNIILLKFCIVILPFSGTSIIFGQTNTYANPKLIKYLHSNSAYTTQKASIIKQFAQTPAGRWGEFVKGVKENMVTAQKVVAFTFDACGGGGKGNGYDSCLVNFLRRETVPATLFVTGLWIDVNYKTFLKLSKDTLFEIENHGFNHRPCSVHGDSIFGIKGTKNISVAYDEIEANAEKIQLITGHRPKFFRSATAYIDETCVKMAKMMGITVVSYGVLSGDAIPQTPAEAITDNVLKHVKPGSIIIMHFNRPGNKTCKALQVIIPKLRAEGYSFTKLEGYPLRGIR
jgi:peptidoglycan/xylan/chitin deacetylase (PgdA/CDA1 family)